MGCTRVEQDFERVTKALHHLFSHVLAISITDVRCTPSAFQHVLDSARKTRGISLAKVARRKFTAITELRKNTSATEAHTRS